MTENSKETVNGVVICRARRLMCSNSRKVYFVRPEAFLIRLLFRLAKQAQINPTFPILELSQ